ACRDHWRSGAYRLTRRAASIDEPVVQSSLTAARDPERDALASERERIVQAAISELPEMLRVPVVPPRFPGPRHEDVARILGIRHDAARKRYSRALTALGRRLRETLG